jgi:hypothetical protein
MESQIFEFENFVPGEICDTIVSWFATRPKMMSNGGNALFNGRTIDYANIQDYTIKRWVNAFKFDATAKAREVFGVDNLYPDYTDLVSWEEGSGMIVHADNCNQDGTPNYCHWREYSGVVFLNDDFAGGDYFFPEQGPHFARPAKGKLVLYPSGLEYRHGVQTIIGTAYTMPIWFTTDKNHIEV